MNYALFCITALSVMAMSSCDGQEGLLPKSGGRPYEVLVVSGGDDNGGRMVDSVLSQDAAGLPQAEPMFDVSLTVQDRFNRTAKLARNIVIVTLNPGQFTTTRLRYERNVWARPQTVVYVNSPTEATLMRDMPKAGRQIAALLTRAETNAAIARLKAARNKEAEAAVREMFGADMMIPADMKAGKRGHDFAWFSNNAASGMTNICVYSYPGTTLDAAEALAARDSAMSRNIPGERQGMHLQTADGTATYGMTSANGRKRMIMRGLWEMRGDAMGGPFVAHLTADTARKRIIVAEAFVYSPDTKKRNLTRQTEAALYTLNLK